MIVILTDRLKFSRADKVIISLGSEFHYFGVEEENDLSKREVLYLGTDNEPFVADLKLRLCVSDTGFSKSNMYPYVRLFNTL